LLIILQSANGIKLEESGDERMDVNGDVEYVFESFDLKDSGLDEFSNVFARFKPPADESMVCAAFCSIIATLTIAERRGWRSLQGRDHLLRR
jgi:hypothetical protein